jgi:hypothetical protein
LKGLPSSKQFVQILYIFGGQLFWKFFFLLAGALLSGAKLSGVLQIFLGGPNILFSWRLKVLKLVKKYSTVEDCI